MRARRLRTVEAYKYVFLSPDRSADERKKYILASFGPIIINLHKRTQGASTKTEKLILNMLGQFFLFCAKMRTVALHGRGPEQRD